jgi:starch-binding outer membrane protein, SusD/RagB family
MKTYIIYLLILGVIMISGCEKLVNIAPPQDQLTAEVVFESDETAISATTGLYAMMMRTDLMLSYNIPMYTGLYSDELEYNQTLPDIQSIYKYVMTARDAPTNQLWTSGFNFIFQANVIIEGLNNSFNISPAVKKQLMGEALFVRAFWNYYLLGFYGEIPLILSSDYIKNSALPRVSIETVRGQIIDDLLSAKDMLTAKYVSRNSIVESTDRIRPNTFTVSSLLARLYLQMGNFSDAEAECSNVISQDFYSISDDLSKVFKLTSQEVIWQLELPINYTASNSYEARMFTLTGKPNAFVPWRCTTLTSDLLSLFSLEDKRRAAWIGTSTDNNVTPSVNYYFPGKYKATTDPAEEYSTPFRLAETYLIRAEARAKLGLTADAINDVDKIRFRAGLKELNDIMPGISEQSLLDYIAIERRRELFCEWGIRWIDITRSNDVNKVLSDIASKKGIIWQPSMALWPIPLNDVINSGNIIKQNEGYN